MGDLPPPSYDDAITGNFSSEPPPPPPSSDAEISVSTSFLGPDRSNVPETIVPFPSSPEPVSSSPPPSPRHNRETHRVTTPRISPSTTTVNNRRSPSPAVVTANNDGSSKSKSRCIKLIAFIVFILIGIGVLYFVLSSPKDEVENYDYSDYAYQPQTTTTTTTTTPRPSSPDDCKTQPPQIVEKRGYGSFQNCQKNYKEEYYNKTRCTFSCNSRKILSTSPGPLDPGYNANRPEIQITFTCVRAEWSAPGVKQDQKIKCLTKVEHIKESVG